MNLNSAVCVVLIGLVIGAAASASWPWFDSRNVDSRCERVRLLECALFADEPRQLCECERQQCQCGDATSCDSVALQCADSSSLVRRRRSVAVISTTVDELYLFFTPLTSLIWRSLMDYDVACVLVGPDPRQSPLHAAVLNATLRVGADVLWVPSVDGIADATVSQVSRLFVPLLYEAADDAYVLTSDNDMWNLDRAHFAQRGGARHPVQLFYGNAYAGRTPPMYPICYIGMRASLWRTVMSSAVPSLADRDAAPFDLAHVTHELIRAGERRYGAEWRVANKATSPQWYYDQIVFGEAIDRWPGHPSQCQVIVRRPGLDRIDRGRWRFDGAHDLAGKIDAHLLRPGFSSENWPRLLLLWQALFRNHSPRLVEFAIDLQRAFQQR